MPKGDIGRPSEHHQPEVRPPIPIQPGEIAPTSRKPEKPPTIRDAITRRGERGEALPPGAPPDRSAIEAAAAQWVQNYRATFGDMVMMAGKSPKGSHGKGGDDKEIQRMERELDKQGITNSREREKFLREVRGRSDLTDDDKALLDIIDTTQRIIDRLKTWEIERDLEHGE
jgi:hypothetical protein